MDIFITIKNNAHALIKKIHGSSLWMLFQAIFSITLLIILFRNFDWQNFLHLIKKIPILFVIYSFILSFSFQFLYALRWNMILKSMDIAIPYKSLAKQIFIGFFFANFAPASIGQDAVKVYYLGRKNGYVNIGASVLIDKFLAFFAMTAIATILLWFSATPAFLSKISKNMMTILFVIFIGCIVATHLPFLKLMQSVSMKYPKLSLTMDRVSELFLHIRGTGSDIRIIIGSTMIVATIFAITSFVYIDFFKITSEIQSNFLAVMTSLCVITIVTNLPISINGLGVREQVHYLFFAGLGVPKETSIGISLLIFSYSLIFSLVGYILWLRHKADEPMRIKS